MLISTQESKSTITTTAKMKDLNHKEHQAIDHPSALGTSIIEEGIIEARVVIVGWVVVIKEVGFGVDVEK